MLLFSKFDVITTSFKSHWLRNELNKCVISYKGDSLIVFRSRVLEWNTVPLHISKVLLRFLGCAGTQT